MNERMETRLRDALAEAGATIEPGTLRPLARTRRRPSWRPWLVAAGVAVVLAGAVTASGARDEPADSPAVMMPMAFTGTYREGGPEIAVFLCTEDSPYPSCGGRWATPGAGGGRAVTPEQIQAVRRALIAMPQVRSVTFRDKATAYVEFREDFDSDEALLDAVSVEDMPLTFQLRMQPGTDWRAVMRAAQAMPGVSNTVDLKCAQEHRDAAVACATGDGPPS
ncbi:permease-like cell division protein FtsX [Sphaerisporangium aureirubrum]|uniref:Permease-like cell division protein FtsX n=1 Tax=Sphaerisporangium aureirubrum TaxID=1544736 RepID=A0ABW1N7Y2_9ACTN